MKMSRCIPLLPLLACAIALPVHAEKIDAPRIGAPVPPSQTPTADTPISYPGGPVPANVTGTLGPGSATFNRPLSGCSGLSAVGTATPYDTITLTNTGASAASINLAMGAAGTPTTCAAGATGSDTFVAVYNGSFNPASPLANCVFAEDDVNGPCAAVSNVPVAPGATIVIVLTAFYNEASFAYEASFAGTTPVTLQSFSVE